MDTSTVTSRQTLSEHIDICACARACWQKLQRPACPAKMRKKIGTVGAALVHNTHSVYAFCASQLWQSSSFVYLQVLAKEEMVERLVNEKEEMASKLGLAEHQAAVLQAQQREEGEGEEEERKR